MSDPSTRPQGLHVALYGAPLSPKYTTLEAYKTCNTYTMQDNEFWYGKLDTPRESEPWVYMNVFR